MLDFEKRRKIDERRRKGMVIREKIMCLGGGVTLCMCVGVGYICVFVRERERERERGDGH